MSEVFFKQLDIPEPDINLDVGSGSHAVQTAAIMQRFEAVALEHTPDMVLVYGDVNSTVAAALVCAKLLIPVAHVEAGLRSGDRTMPEEINRIVTDQLADLLFTPSVDGDENLLREGIVRDKIHRVGNVMIDTLLRLLPKAEQIQIDLPEQYVLVTLHRPANVDAPDMLVQIVNALEEISQGIPVLFPIHPRTRARIAEFGLSISNNSELRLLNPLGYLEFLKMQRYATAVITDSGGIQEETTLLQVPCLTVRENTERPITVTLGTNTLVGRDIRRLLSEVNAILNGHAKKGGIPPLWDGRAGERIADIVSSNA